MKSHLTFLVSGIVFGLSGGLTPGPLLTLVISETLKHGIREGIKISLAPLVTDLPIILVAVFLLSRLANIHFILGLISICGAAFLVYLGFESISFRGAELSAVSVNPQSLKKGIVANFLNPSPYLFWLSIGAPMVIKAADVSLLAAIFFIAGFYILLVGSKVIVAVLLGRSRQFLKSNRYIYTIRLLGVALLFFALIFLRDGLDYLGVFSSV
jgi:threonine/homoserine/homoserine lactone efflux protein